MNHRFTAKGSYWDPKEVDRLIKLIEAGNSAEEIARMMGRGKASITSKIQKLRTSGTIEGMRALRAGSHDLGPQAQVMREPPANMPRIEGFVWIQNDAKTWRAVRKSK